MERALQVGDRCYIYNSVDLVIIDAINPVGVPNTYTPLRISPGREGVHIFLFSEQICNFPTRNKMPEVSNP